LVDADAPGALVVTVTSAQGASGDLVLREGTGDALRVVVSASPGLREGVLVVVTTSDDTVAVKGPRGSVAQLTPSSLGASFVLSTPDDGFALGDRAVNVSVAVLQTSSADQAFQPSPVLLNVGVVDDDVAGVRVSAVGTTAQDGAHSLRVVEGSAVRLDVACLSSIPFGGLVTLALSVSLPTASITPAQVTCEGDRTSTLVTLTVDSDSVVVCAHPALFLRFCGLLLHGCLSVLRWLYVVL
jgi:hypothetical protein